MDFGLILGDLAGRGGILVDFGNPRPIWKENWAGFAKNVQKRPKIAKISQNWGSDPFFGPNGPGRAVWGRFLALTGRGAQNWGFFSRKAPENR